MWRTATASDATFTARAVGLDTSTATTLDNITVSLHEQWLDTKLTPHDNIQLFTSINDGGFGFTSTLHIKDTALVASWQQVTPAILSHTGHANMGDLLNELPNTKTQLQTATNNIDPTLWADITEITPDTTIPKHQQKRLTTLVRKLHTTAYTNALDTRAMGVHHSTGGVGAGAWLHPPIKDIVPLTNEDFTTAAKIRLTNHTPNNQPNATEALQPALASNPSTYTSTTHSRVNTDHTESAGTTTYAMTSPTSSTKSLGTVP